MRQLSLSVVISSFFVLVSLIGDTYQAAAVPGQTTRVSVPNLADQGTLGAEANADSTAASISADGRFVAFESEATNLVLGDTNGVQDIFVHDRLTGETERVSVDSFGGEANGASYDPEISDDGNVVAFESDASNLVSGDAFGFRDILVHNRTTGATEMASVSSSGSQANGTSYDPSLSSAGSLVAFESNADSLVPDPWPGNYDIFLRDLGSGTTIRVSPGLGTQNSRRPSVTADANFIAYQSSNLALYDRQLGTTVSIGADSIYKSDVSDDGRYVAFDTNSVLAGGDSGVNYDVYVRDRQLAVWELISVKPDGTSTGLLSSKPSASSDGRFVAFFSGPDGSVSAQGLVPGDSNGNSWGVFVRDRLLMTTRRVSLGGGSPDISTDGHFVAFSSSSPDHVPGDSNGVSDIFVADQWGDYDDDGYIDPEDNCWSVSNPSQADGDGDIAGDACDNCPSVPNAGQWDGDSDGVGNLCDNCSSIYNNSQTNTDGDAQGDVCDSDDDNDLLTDFAEESCGSDPLDASSRPERIDGAFAVVDDDGDTQVNEPLPGGTEAYDCDRDGYTGSREAAILAPSTQGDQDPCGTDGWPSNFVSGGIFESTNRVRIDDLNTFLSPRRLDANPGDPDFSTRWDLVPGPGMFSSWISIQDLNALLGGSSAYPPMLGGERALNGPECPWQP
jgi:hypothetical protein